MKPLISVIIPTYQRSDKLKIAIQSVLAQTFVNFEVLIMDDGSEDGTRDIVNSFKDHRIFYSWQKNTGGPASPRNNGIKIAKGEWIALLDDDDAWAENKLDEVMNMAIKAHKVIGCRGVTRSDFKFYKNKFYLSIITKIF